MQEGLEEDCGGGRDEACCYVGYCYVSEACEWLLVVVKTFLSETEAVGDWSRGKLTAPCLSPRECGEAQG